MAAEDDPDLETVLEPDDLEDEADSEPEVEATEDEAETEPEAEPEAELEAEPEAEAVCEAPDSASSGSILEEYHGKAVTNSEMDSYKAELTKVVYESSV